MELLKKAAKLYYYHLHYVKKGIEQFSGLTQPISQFLIVVTAANMYLAQPLAPWAVITLMFFGFVGIWVVGVVTIKTKIAAYQRELLNRENHRILRICKDLDLIKKKLEVKDED